MLSSIRIRPLASARGSATTEQAGLLLLVAVLVAAAVVAAARIGEPGLGARIADRIACGPRAGGVCRTHATVGAYGWPLARLVRALAPEPLARANRDGVALVPVDFRYCRRPSCAVPLGGARGRELTVSNRRTTAFTEVRDGRRADGTVEVVYWLYRPELGWERIARSAGRAEVEEAGSVRVLESDSPKLVPLETLPGRNHYEFSPEEEPPWRWRVAPVNVGWSS